jgi:hypothetical protein
MPWLHRLFDAWEDYQRQREREAVEAAEHEANTFAAMAEFGHDEVFEAEEDNDSDEKQRRKKMKEDKKEKKKNRKKHRKEKDKDKHRK